MKEKRCNSRSRKKDSAETNAGGELSDHTKVLGRLRNGWNDRAACLYVLVAIHFPWMARSIRNAKIWLFFIPSQKKTMMP